MTLLPSLDTPGSWRHATRRSLQRRALSLVGVLLLHVLLLLAWRAAIRTQVDVTVAQAPTLMWLRTAAPTPRPATPTPPEVRPERPNPPQPTPRIAAPPRTQALRPDAPVAPPAERPNAPTEPVTAAITAATPSPPASAPPTPPPSLLDTDATRQAIRQIGRQALLSERAADASNLPIQRGDTQLSEAAAKAGKGDCLKGEFLGAGAGLLSVPFLALAAARGQCAK